MSFSLLHIQVLGTREFEESSFSLDSREGWIEVSDSQYVYCFENIRSKIRMRYPKAMTCVTEQVYEE